MLLLIRHIGAPFIEKGQSIGTLVSPSVLFTLSGPGSTANVTSTAIIQNPNFILIRQNDNNVEYFILPYTVTSTWNLMQEKAMTLVARGCVARSQHKGDCS